jgi:hypothetical protein
MTLAKAKRSVARACTSGWIWPLSPIVLSACFAAGPAGAAGWLDFDQGWSGASICVDATDVGCVDHVQPTSVTLIGYDSVDSQLVYMSPTVPLLEPGYTNFSFFYAFNPIPNQTAFYQFAGNKVPLDSTAGLAAKIMLTGILGPGQSLGFGVANTNNVFPAELILSDFSYQTANPSLPNVPGPLPLMGLAAAYGWMRQLRSIQRGRHGAGLTARPPVLFDG